MSKRCIISFANQNGYYVDRLARLSNSLRDNFKTGDFLGFIHEASLGAPLHSTDPYSFKVYAFLRAIDMQYTSVIWLDSSCYAVANVDGLFDSLENDEPGLIFQDAGHYLGDWCNDDTLEYFGLSREKAKSLRMIGNAGFLGINFLHENGENFFTDWRNAQRRGYFKGDWANHRHDMSCSSAIIHELDLFKHAIPGDQVLQYGGIYDKVANDSIIIKAQG